MKLRSLLPCLLFSLSVLLSWGAEPLPLPKSTPWDVEALAKAPTFEWVDKEAKVKSLTYRGLPYKGKPTSVFAYYASPSSFGVKGKKFPALTLVHGGGGTAFNKWAELLGQARLRGDRNGLGRQGGGPPALARRRARPRTRPQVFHHRRTV